MRNFKRNWYAALAVLWVAIVGYAAVQGGAGLAGYWSGILALATPVWIVVGWVLSSIFGRGAAKSDPAR